MSLTSTGACRVIAWEPVPRFRHFLEYGIQLNGFQERLHVRPYAAADSNNETYTLQVPQRGIWGTASIGGGNIDRCAAFAFLADGGKLVTRKCGHAAPDAREMFLAGA